MSCKYHLEDLQFPNQYYLLFLICTFIIIKHQIKTAIFMKFCQFLSYYFHICLHMKLPVYPKFSFMSSFLIIWSIAPWKVTSLKRTRKNWYSLHCSPMAWETWVSVPGWVIPKTQKMVLDASLLNTQHYKVRIKGKVEQSRQRSSTLPYTLV